ncbi:MULTISPECIES: TraB/GumN family protein [unclassified Brevundimonas]|uniref:TraB/GumN family protein n=1 Tax=unclassified Brevundimonas TaxID=2622653 RepID=UPI000CFAF8E8|nr:MULTISPECIES: TraB/GumN family protein [unclassified Brevundimonas]PRA26439.1 TraB/GumN family protein [Brevundimonas sp. MYb27]PQZ75880.1 TraB/GumN family protein [Brevundimonas sp. MYb31]PRB11588.1 TraB/GumN family protein [Brevundimonas sp. MYb52]PRB32729.1 TraB/GumN family protein [Brevundimonas sp. MYb46]PRB45708.1 TraB/GumN family protein [Brevundimonas sp. MYb33]
MTLANRMGRTANHVSRMAFGACAALAASAVLAAFPGAAHAEQAAAAPAAAVAAAPIPRAEGAGPPLWVVKDADSTIYLFGTIHYLRPGTAWGSDKVDAAFASADQFWVEVADQDDPSVAAKVAQQHGVTPDRPLSSILSAEDFAAFDKAAQGVGANGAALDAYRPWLAAFVVAGTAPMQAGYRPDAGVDKTLMDRARAEGKTIHGFETADRQLRLIAGMSEEAQIAYLNNYVRHGDQIVPKLDQTVAAWLKGDAAEVGRLNRLDTRAVHPDVHRAALIERNTDWAAQIETMMQGSGSAFVAVGVAHLADQDSVVDMLKARGYTVERL